jgi:hypothetical protein
MQNLTAVLQGIQRAMKAGLAPSEAGAMHQQTLMTEVMRTTGTDAAETSKAMELFELLLPLMEALGGNTPQQQEMQDRDASLQLAAAMKNNVFFRGFVDFYFDKSFHSGHLYSKHSRASIFFGAPLEGYASQADRPKEQDAKLSSWIRDSFQSFLEDATAHDAVELVYYASPLVWDEILSILTRDMLMAIISVAFVFAWIWGHSGSFFLAVVGM